jgi:hypothetical protein
VLKLQETAMALNTRNNGENMEATNLLRHTPYGSLMCTPDAFPKVHFSSRDRIRLELMRQRLNSEKLILLMLRLITRSSDCLPDKNDNSAPAVTKALGCRATRRSLFLASLAALIALGGCTQAPVGYAGMANAADRRQTLSNEQPLQSVNCPDIDPNDISPRRREEMLADADRHILAVSSTGNIIDPKTGNLSEEDQDIAAIFAEYERYINASSRGKEEKKRMMIYVNGGLNSLPDMRWQAAVRIPCMKRDGYFPVFLTWSTGFFSSYWEQILYSRDGARRSRMQFASVPFYILGDIGQGIVRSPVTFYEHLQAFWQSSLSQDKPWFRVADDDRLFKNDGPVTANTNVLTDPDVDQASTGWGKWIPYALTTPVRVVTTPFADAGGDTAWEAMVRRSRASVRRPAEFNNVDPDLTKTRWNDITKYPGGAGGFSVFFHHLNSCIEPRESWIDRYPNGRKCTDERFREVFKDLKITLIGHSMGTIVLNDLVWSYPKLPYEDIVYMAAACSIKDFTRSIMPLLEERNGNTKFYNLMLHPLNDALELSYGGSVPLGSLLVWIDDMYQEPEAWTDRTLGNWANIHASKHVFSERAQKHMLFRVFRREAKEGNIIPIKHGDFNETRMDYWRPSFWGKEAVRWNRNDVPAAYMGAASK